MRCVYWLLSIGACVGAGLLGLAAGINLNPESTVKFVPVLDANAWSAAGAWLGAIATFCAVALALYYSRRDDRQKLKLISLGHTQWEGNPGVDHQLTLRAVCIGRLPTTVIDVGLGDSGDDQVYVSVGQFSPAVYSKTYLSRGEIFEVTLSHDDLKSLGNSLSREALRAPQKLMLIVKTGLKSEREGLSPEAVETLRKVFSQIE
ncbi:hypothetical protein D3C77_500110 [compost metagenome]